MTGVAEQAGALRREAPLGLGRTSPVNDLEYQAAR
jgi:hypothetical protein